MTGISRKHFFEPIKRGQAYQQLEKYDKAIEDHTKAIEINPEIDLAFNNRGFDYRAIGKFELVFLSFLSRSNFFFPRRYPT